MVCSSSFIQVVRFLGTFGAGDQMASPDLLDLQAGPNLAKPFVAAALRTRLSIDINSPRTKYGCLFIGSQLFYRQKGKYTLFDRLGITGWSLQFGAAQVSGFGWKWKQLGQYSRVAAKRAGWSS